MCRCGTRRAERSGTWRCCIRSPWNRRKRTSPCCKYSQRAGALANRDGRFTLADGGTIFLDEVGELPPDTQVKLLRVLQEQELEPIGSSKTIKVDVRIIAATNRDLSLMEREGKFRSDLFYHLNVFPVTMPPLRERQEDIHLLVMFFLEKFARKLGKPI